jgi:hypothetical protein
MLLKFQSANYNQYITISNSTSQAKSYLTYDIFSNTLLVWLNQRHGSGRCINASGASISGYLVQKRIIPMFAQSVKVLIGTSHGKTHRQRAKNSSAACTVLGYNKNAHGRLASAHAPRAKLSGLSPCGGKSITITTSPTVIVMIVLLRARSYRTLTMTASFLFKDSPTRQRRAFHFSAEP